MPARTPKTTQTLIPLKGQDNFMRLMRTKPLASWQNCRIHGAKVDSGVILGQIVLGQIIPKKLFPLAVDRNRARRIARAHARELATQLKPIENVQVLLRLSPTKKTPQTTKNAQRHAVKPPLENPHTRCFANALRATLNQAIQRLHSA